METGRSRPTKKNLPEDLPQADLKADEKIPQTGLMEKFLRPD